MPRFRIPMIFNKKMLSNKESGYLLASSAIILLVLIALVGSFAFVMTRDSRFKGNYAAGERLATLATFAHSYAQNQYYSLGTDIDNVDLLPLMQLPDNIAFSPVAHTAFSIEIIGSKEAPLDRSTDVRLKAASAYIHFRIRSNSRPPSDDAALQAGANHNGMSRFGFYETGIDPLDKCNIDPLDPTSFEVTAVRWGPEPSACLGNTQAITMFTDLQKGDIIVPAWETALSHINQNAMMRYPQPERPDMTTMATPLKMNGERPDGTSPHNNITDVKTATTDQLNIDPTSTTSSTFGTMLMRASADPANPNVANFSGPVPVAMTQGLKVYNQNGGVGTSMDVAGTVEFKNNLNVSQDINGPANLNVAVIPDPGNPSAQTLVQSIHNQNMLNIAATSGNTLTMRVRNISQPLGKLDLSIGANSNLAISGNLNANSIPSAPAPTINSLEIYAANMTMEGTAAVTSTTAWSVNAINQVGNDPDHYMALNNLTINKCLNITGGTACPDTITGGNGGL